MAEIIIGNIDDNGRLAATEEELAAATGAPLETVLEVLKAIQAFEPPGVGARNLRECLMLQLERAGQQSTLEYRIINEFMEALGKRRIPEIARGTGASIDEVQDSLSWTKGELDDPPLPESDGHIVVLRGFDAGGDPIVNDPAQVTIRVTYPRAQFQRLWLAHGGVAYVIASQDKPAVELANA